MIELKLHLYIEQHIEKTIIVSRDIFTLGRAIDCDWHLPYFGISRYHARIFKKPEGVWFIEDMGSRNGTVVNEQLVESPQILKHGDVIQLGSVYLSALFYDDSLKINNDDMDTQVVGMTIFRNVQDLRQQWIQADDRGDEADRQEITISRLKDLLDIAQGLNSAVSIEAIFKAAQAVVFRYLDKIERLALLIDINGSGKLELLKGAARDVYDQKYLKPDGSWISRTICQKVFNEKVAIQTADAQKDNRFDSEQSIIDKGIHNVMAVPLWDEDKVVGVLYADGHVCLHDSHQGSEEDISFFSTLANLVAASVQRWLLTRKLRNEEKIRHRLERYHSPAVVQQMMMAGTLENSRLLPKESEISILFADIVGFTALSERLSPAEIANLLNSFFEEMLQEVFTAGGTLDKFIGDCIMAFFGAPEPQPDHADRAFAAAKGMLDRLDNLNAKKALREPLQLRIAINTGKAVVGDVGSSQRVDYTVLGATINLASRMEAICPIGKCVVSETTYNMLRPSQRIALDDMGEYRFKGIDRPIRVYYSHRSSITEIITD
ncbi:FHA domain-containing protein [Planktothrix sp. FACHB-1355]|uniref:FHA domain-containing protein n=1 Tax=Aerosakkonema funiforme FACHB-1375 TaxID=2949571 RepID=A0A926VD09_9CYAN|nr:MULTISPECIES: adenylate/guanylate cyclase domain-containing protein [Oscillatoriales]MBD2181541.1 FHA domain-containing protein [Aerosakkonema funiforme FACHB-1375]MBD3558962.1 FHA domain-containing protein [Planktothrix sp. FACHB-1355]